MKDNGRKIAFLQKKLEHLDNDLFKNIAKDYFKMVMEQLFGSVAGTNSTDSLEALRKSYISQIKKLRQNEKAKTRQMDIEDEIKKEHQRVDREIRNVDNPLDVSF